MRVNFIRTLCVNQCLMDSRLVGISFLELYRFKPRSNKTRYFDIMVKGFSQSSRPECKKESFCITRTQRKIDCFSVDGFRGHCNTVFEAFGCFYHFCECEEVQPGLIWEDIVKGHKKREVDKLRR